MYNNSVTIPKNEFERLVNHIKEYFSEVKEGKHNVAKQELARISADTLSGWYVEENSEVENEGLTLETLQGVIDSIPKAPDEAILLAPTYKGYNIYTIKCDEMLEALKLVKWSEKMKFSLLPKEPQKLG